MNGDDPVLCIMILILVLIMGFSIVKAERSHTEVAKLQSKINQLESELDERKSDERKSDDNVSFRGYE